jgi:hypothetical protein
MHEPVPASTRSNTDQCGGNEEQVPATYPNGFSRKQSLYKNMNQPLVQTIVTDIFEFHEHE